jgi:hypothetical protein
MSLVINKTQLLKIIGEELQKAVKEGYSLSSLNPEEWEEPQAHDDKEEGEFPELEWPEGTGEDPEGLRADAILGGGPGGWQRAKDEMTPPPKRPPKEYRRQAIHILASFNVDVGQQAIDILAWELVNAAAQAETEPLEGPAEKPSWLQKILGKAIREDLKAHMGQHNLREAEQGQISAIRHFTQGMPYEVESILIQLVDRYGFDLEEAEQLANELKRMQGSDLEGEPQLAQYVKEELEGYLDEVYSKKQRDFMCAMKDAPDGDRPESLSQGEAEHMCKAPMEKPKSKRKNK